MLEGLAEDVLRPDLVSRLKMGGICEGVPEARLARLLKRIKFEEAEKFAASFNLDKEQIHHARASWLLNFLSAPVTLLPEKNRKQSRGCDGEAAAAGGPDPAQA